MGEESSSQELDTYEEYLRLDFLRERALEDIRNYKSYIGCGLGEITEEHILLAIGSKENLINWIESNIKPLCDNLGFKYPWIPLTVEDIGLKMTILRKD